MKIWAMLCENQFILYMNNEGICRHFDCLQYKLLSLQTQMSMLDE